MSKNTSETVKPNWVGLIWIAVAVLVLILGAVFLPT